MVRGHRHSVDRAIGKPREPNPLDKIRWGKKPLTREKLIRIFISPPLPPTPPNVPEKKKTTPNLTPQSWLPREPISELKVIRSVNPWAFEINSICSHLHHWRPHPLVAHRKLVGQDVLHILHTIEPEGDRVSVLGHEVLS